MNVRTKEVGDIEPSASGPMAGIGQAGIERLMIVAGEPSGDLHAAALVRSLRKLQPSISVFGMGGSSSEKEGMELVVDAEHSASVMGLTEVVGSIRRLLGILKQLVTLAEQRRPDAVVLIDFPDFNLRLAKALKRKGFRVIYFVTPQVWAWRTSRVKSIRRDFAAVLPIFPFEEAFFREHGVEAHYVGHPFMDRPPLDMTRGEFLGAHGIDPQRPVLALLPGSRSAELRSLLEPMIQAYLRLRSCRPGLQAVLPVAPTFKKAEIESQVAAIFQAQGQSYPDPDFRVLDGQAREVLSYADVAVLASGTVTVDAALSGIPSVVVYKFSPFTYRMARLLVRGVKHFAMANLIAPKQVFPELLQEQVTPGRIAAEVELFLGDPKKYRSTKTALQQIRTRLAQGIREEGSATDRAAKYIVNLVQKSRQKKPRSSEKE